MSQAQDGIERHRLGRKFWVPSGSSLDPLAVQTILSQHQRRDWVPRWRAKKTFCAGAGRSHAAIGIAHIAYPVLPAEGNGPTPGCGWVGPLRPGCTGSLLPARLTAPPNVA